MNEVEVAMKNDARLFQMATYYVTEGLIKVVDIDKVYRRYGVLKKLILRGSFTIDQMEAQIYSQYGIVPLTNEQKDFNEMMRKSWVMKNEKEENENFNSDDFR